MRTDGSLPRGPWPWHRAALTHISNALHVARAQPDEAGFYYACNLSELPIKKGVKVKLHKRSIAVFRLADGTIYAMENSCEHQVRDTQPDSLTLSLSLSLTLSCLLASVRLTRRALDDTPGCSLVVRHADGH